MAAPLPPHCACFIICRLLCLQQPGLASLALYMWSPSQFSLSLKSLLTRASTSRPFYGRRKVCFFYSPTVKSSAAKIRTFSVAHNNKSCAKADSRVFKQTFHGEKGGTSERTLAFAPYNGLGNSISGFHFIRNPVKINPSGLECTQWLEQRHYSKIRMWQIHTHTLAQRRVSSNRVWQSSLASSEARAIQLYLSESRQTLAQRELP